MLRTLLVLLVAALVAAACAGAGGARRDAQPPDVHAELAPVLYWSSRLSLAVPTRREPIEDVLFGVPVRDPYRWLEQGDDAEVRAWISAQNQVFERSLARVPGRQQLFERLSELLEIGDLSRPDVQRTKGGGERLFYTRREGKQNQPVLYVRDGASGTDRVLLDPNRLDANGSVALDWFYPSHDGELVAYGLSRDGSEESTLYVRNVATLADLPDVIPRTRHATVCWAPDRRRFFYSRYPKPGSVPAGEEHYHRVIYEHVLGRAPAGDELVFGKDLPLTDYPGCDLSPDGRWLVVQVHQGWSKSELYLADTRKRPLAFSRLTGGKAHVYDALARDDVIWVRTNEGASRYALYAVDPARPERSAWRLVVPEHASDVLTAFTPISKQVLAVYSIAGASRLERYDQSGRSLGPIALPVLGSSDGFSGIHDGEFAYFDFQSFAVPPAVYRLDLRSGQSTIWQRVTAPINPDDYTVSSRRAQSKDGTQVPYVIVARRGTNLQSRGNPTVLHGYGGFNVSLEPRFSRVNYALYEKGVVFVQANLRGGGEFGEAWHRAGQLEQKQNVFDDFIAVADHLITTGLTRPEQLAISGRSNGGLLVAAAITQRPELFGAAVSGVPLTDMLRYHRFLIAKLWVPEYGSPEDADHFQFLHRYSPYHRVKPGTAYPAVLLTTAASDTRVDPMHARKFAAALQHATTSLRPVFLRSEMQAGHGAGKPITKIAEEQADVFAFLLWQLGVLPGAAD